MIARDEEFDTRKYFEHPEGGAIGRRMGAFVASPVMLNHIDISHSEKAVYRALVQHADNQTNITEIGAARLAFDTGYSVVQVRRDLKALVKAGLIRRLRRGYHLPGHKRVPSKYLVLYPSNWPPKYRAQLVRALQTIRDRKLYASRTDLDAENA